MSQINFLPESFRRNRRRMQRRPLEFAAIALTLVGLIALWTQSNGPDRALASRAAEIEQGLQAIQTLEQQHDKLERDRSALQRKLIVARETYQPIHVTHVLARLSAMAPRPVRLVNFEIVTERPEPEARAEDTTHKTRRRVVGRAKDQDKQADQPSTMRIYMTGLAPSDDEVVELIRSIQQDPVFTSVAMRSSRSIQTKTHAAREFSLEVAIDLDRRFVPADGRGEASDAY